jgi:hypothetical protein
VERLGLVHAANLDAAREEANSAAAAEKQARATEEQEAAVAATASAASAAAEKEFEGKLCAREEEMELKLVGQMAAQRDAFDQACTVCVRARACARVCVDMAVRNTGGCPVGCLSVDKFGSFCKWTNYAVLCYGVGLAA